MKNILNMRNLSFATLFLCANVYPMKVVNDTSKDIQYKLYECEKEVEEQYCDLITSKYVLSKKSDEITAPGASAFYSLHAIHKKEYGFFIDRIKGIITHPIYLNANCVATSSEINGKIQLTVQGCGRNQ